MMNRYPKDRRLFALTVVAYSIVVLVLAFALLTQPTPQTTLWPLIGQTVVVEHGSSSRDSYGTLYTTGPVVAMSDGWITLSTGDSSTITIPASRVHRIRTETE